MQVLEMLTTGGGLGEAFILNSKKDIMYAGVFTLLTILIIISINFSHVIPVNEPE